MPRALSIFAKICWLGIAFPLSYSVTTWGFSQIFVARSFWDISLACLPWAIVCPHSCQPS